MSTTETQREQEWVTGVVTGIVQKGADKWQVVVQPDGSQYTKNLWTKEQPSVASLSTMIGQRLAFLCNISHWNHSDGTPVRSLWLVSFGQPAQADPQNAWETAQQAQAVAQTPPPYSGAVNAPVPQGPMVTAQPQPVQIQTQPPVVHATLPNLTQDIKEQRIHRQTASKVAAIMLTHVAVEERTMSTLLVLAERLVAYYNDGLPQAPELTLDDLIVQATPRTVDEGPAPLPADDDIPF